MLVRLMYASRAVESAGEAELTQILQQSKRNNPGVGVTGVLCLSAGIYLQVLEGGRNAVSALYNKIAADPRHKEVVILRYEEIDERSFGSWSMGQANLSRLNPAVVIKYSETAELDPYSVSGRVSMALFHELVASAAVLGKG